MLIGNTEVPKELMEKFEKLNNPSSRFIHTTQSIKLTGRKPHTTTVLLLLRLNEQFNNDHNL